jgi:hypothetical protein
MNLLTAKHNDLIGYAKQDLFFYYMIQVQEQWDYSEAENRG